MTEPSTSPFTPVATVIAQMTSTAWRVESPEGETLGVRELLHPHVDEQPFTRSLGGVVVPEGTETVRLRARDSLDGWAETAFDLALPAD